MEDDREPWWAEDPELLAIRRRVLEEFECVQREPIESDQPDPVSDDMLSGASSANSPMRATTCTRPRPVRRGGPSGPCVWPLMERDRPGARRFEATAAPPIPRSRPGRAAPCRKRRRGRSPHRASWARPAPPTGRGVLRTFRVARRKECWRLGFRWWGVGVMAPSRQRPPRFSTSLAVRRAIVRPATASSCNRLGFWLGAGAQSDVDTGPDQVHPSDLRTCEHLGRRVAFVTRQLVAGRIGSPAASFPAASSAPAR